MANGTLTEGNTEYNFDWCLEDGNYQFTLGDHSRWKDGLCCEAGQGGYAISANGVVIASDYGDQSWETQVFDIVIDASGGGTSTTCEIFKVSIMTDFYSEDTSWALEKEGDLLFSFPPPWNPDQILTQKNHEYNYEFCLDEGNYVFTLGDSIEYKDGLCCDYGNGYFAGTLGGIQIFGRSDEFAFDVLKFPFEVKLDNIFL